MTTDTHGAAPDTPARVFLSWSGEPSKLLAEAVADALRALSSRLEPWMSDDLEAGVEWAKALVPQIKKAKLAVLCLTHRNVNAPWITFEAGAYFTSRIRKGVVPFLLDFSPDELTFPLGLFQSQRADWKGSRTLLLRAGELAGIPERDVQEKFEREIWPQLGDRLTTIRGLAPGAIRTDEPGEWMNVANAFFLGHDLRWTIDVLVERRSPDDAKHGLLQILHQADELGLSQHDYFLILATQANEVFDLPGEHWTPEVWAKLETNVKQAFDRFGRLVIDRQPGYHACDPKNRENWLKYQAAGRA
jgi:hypothetical protein